jgi:hypothetical protein
MPDDRDAFEALIEPLCKGLREVAVSSRDVRERRGLLPAADAPAMRELEQGAQLTNEAGHSVLQDSWSHVAVLLFAAEDEVFAMCRLLEWDSLPVYAHTVVARAALEASLWSSWLAEPDIDIRFRAGRDLTLRIADQAEAAQIAEAAEKPDAANLARERARTLRERAERNGLRVLPARRHQPREIEEQRPSIGKLARTYLGDDEDKTHGRLGTTLWKSYCGVAHAGMYALRAAIESDEIEHDPMQPGIARATFVTRSRDVQIVLAATALAYTPAMAAYVRLMGRQDEMEWLEAAQRLFALVRTAFPKPSDALE